MGWTIVVTACVGLVLTGLLSTRAEQGAHFLLLRSMF